MPDCRLLFVPIQIFNNSKVSFPPVLTINLSDLYLHLLFMSLESLDDA